MPIYEYQCSACEHEFEMIQKFSDKPVKNCPQCAKRGSVSKKLSASAFILSGGGWYNDGYGAKKNGKESSSESKSVSAGAESKADSSGGSDGGSASTASDASCGHGACGHCAA